MFFLTGESDRSSSPRPAKWLSSTRIAFFEPGMS
jgi:hypothetical protein